MWYLLGVGTGALIVGVCWWWFDRHSFRLGMGLVRVHARLLAVTLRERANRTGKIRFQVRRSRPDLPRDYGGRERRIPPGR